jgi:hypothetical protein
VKIAVASVTYARFLAFGFWLPLTAMPSFYSEVTINAPRFAVWDALVRKEEWHRWNTFLYDCDPNLMIQPGGEIFLALRRREGDDETEFQPRVVVVQTNRCLRWVARGPGFKSDHTFELEDIGPNRTKYIHQERISGLLSPVFLPFIRRDEKEGIRRMARQIKRYVEHDYRRRW